MNKKNHIITACLLAVVLLIVIYTLVSRTDTDEGVEIFIFSRDIAAGTMLGKSDVISVTAGKGFIEENKVKELISIEGMYTKRDIIKGQIVFESELIENRHTTVYEGILPGNVLYTLLLRPEQANGWWLLPDNLIEILIYDEPGFDFLNNPDTSEKILPFNVNIMKGIRIIKIMDENGKCIEKTQKDPKMLCVELSVNQAEQLFEAENTKKIKIVMGNN